MHLKPSTTFLVIVLLVLAAGGTYSIAFSGSNILVSYLICLNIISFLLCGYDKAISGTAATRVPEKLFYLIVLAGGGFGLLLGMHLVRHKTRKTIFQLIVVTIIGIQVIVINYFKLIP